MSWICMVFIVICGLIFLTALAGRAGHFIFKARMKKEALVLFKNTNGAATSPIQEKDLKGLPEPVKRFLKYTRVIGRERIQTVRLKMKGKMRLKPGQRWLSLRAEEYYTTDPPAFVWLGRIFLFPLFSVAARDRYFSGEGNIKIKLLSLFQVSETKGKEMDEASLVRFLNEMMWFPTAYLNDNVRWESIDSESARISISNKGQTVSAVCHFNDKDEMVDFVAERHNTESGKKEEWHTPIHKYREFGGLRIPSKGEAFYRRSSGDFSYIRLEITDIDYDTTAAW